MSTKPQRSSLIEALIDATVESRLTLFDVILRMLAMSGDGRRILIGREVCKKWQRLVDQMDNGHWAVMHACTVDNETISKFLLARSETIYEQAEAHGDMKDQFIKVLTKRAPTPGMYLLLGLCKQRAMHAACEPKRFAAAFDNELRGMAYYAVWMGTRSQDVSNDDVVRMLLRWWEATLTEVRESVERQLAHRSAADKQAARDSLVNFVDKMADVPFHACRKTLEFSSAGKKKLETAAVPPTPASSGT